MEGLALLVEEEGVEAVAAGGGGEERERSARSVYANGRGEHKHENSLYKCKKRNFVLFLYIPEVGGAAAAAVVEASRSSPMMM
jgi:hypothetical protein